MVLALRLNKSKGDTIMDRTKQKLVVFDKDNKQVVESAIGTATVAITGLAAGTKVATGDYKVAFSDGTLTSDLVDIPAFEVPAQEAAKEDTDYSEMKRSELMAELKKRNIAFKTTDKDVELREKLK